MVDNETNLKIKTLRSDNDGEFTSNEFWYFCEEHGIKREYLVAGTPQRNGVVENKNRVVQEITRTMMNESKIAEVFGYNQYIQLFTY